MDRLASNSEFTVDEPEGSVLKISEDNWTFLSTTFDFVAEIVMLLILTLF